MLGKKKKANEQDTINGNHTKKEFVPVFWTAFLKEHQQSSNLQENMFMDIDAFLFECWIDKHTPSGKIKSPSNQGIIFLKYVQIIKNM